MTTEIKIKMKEENIERLKVEFKETKSNNKKEK
jgi:hypothetical protein